MSDKKIKVCFLPPYIKDAETLSRLLRIEDLKDFGDFEIDNETPDYVITTEWIYYKIAKKFKRLVYNPQGSKRPVTIFFTEECVSPDFNIFDYAICWNWGLNYLDRTARIPPHIFIGYSSFKNELSKDEALKSLREDGRDFCNFLYSNSENPSKFRDELFYSISSYKHVDSLGAHLNNTGSLIISGGGGGTGKNRDCLMQN